MRKTFLLWALSALLLTSCSSPSPSSLPSTEESTDSSLISSSDLPSSTSDSSSSVSESDISTSTSDTGVPSSTSDSETATSSDSSSVDEKEAVAAIASNAAAGYRKNRDVNLVTGFGLDGYQISNKKNAHTRKNAVMEDDDRITDNPYADFNCLSIVLDLQAILNDRLLTYYKTLTGILKRNKLKTDTFEIGEIHSEQTGQDFVYLRNFQPVSASSQMQYLNDIYLYKTTGRLITFLLGEGGYEINIHWDIEDYNEEFFGSDYQVSVDEHYQILLDDNGGVKRASYIASRFEDNFYYAGSIYDVYNQDYIVMERQDDGSVTYLHYLRGLRVLPDDMSRASWNTFEDIVYKDEMYVVSDFEYREGEPDFPDPLLGSDERVFWTIQIGQKGVLGDVRLFPFSEWLAVSTDFIEGYEAMYFPDDWLESCHDLGFLGTLAHGIEINGAIYDPDPYAATGYTFPIFPVASTFSIDGNGVATPGRLEAALFAQPGRTDSFYDIIVEGLASWGSRPTFDESTIAFLQGLTQTNVYDRETIKDFVDLDLLDEWKDSDIASIIRAERIMFDVTQEIRGI